MTESESYFVDANLEGAPVEVLSPSGAYRLVIQTYRTRPGCWSYTRGTVTRLRDGAVVADIKRNLHAFHHSFAMKDDREYLITGREYTSQTIVDLERGIEYAPEGDPDAGGFCWAAASTSPDGNTLLVDGCIWACPYELRFFDFTDPARGWRPLPVVGLERLEDPSRRRPPRWLDANTVECHLFEVDGEPQERLVLRRDGAAMTVVEHWISDAERRRRDAEQRAEAELDAWWEQFRTSDPMYLRLVELVREHRVPCENLGWPAGLRRLSLYFRRVSPRAAADLTWDVDAQRLTVTTYDGGKRQGDQVLEYSVAGIEAAVLAIAARFR